MKYCTQGLSQMKMYVILSSVVQFIAPLIAYGQKRSIFPIHGLVLYRLTKLIVFIKEFMNT